MLQLAIIGLGGWGRRLVDSVQGNSCGVRFSTAIVSRPDRSRSFGDTHNLRLSADLQMVLADDKVDGVVSSGPAHLHAPHALAALEAGKPVLAVKPMALTAPEAAALAAAAEKRGLLLALGYNRCFFPNVLEMRRRLRANALGELLHTEGDFCVDRYLHINPGNWKGDPNHVRAGSLADHMLYLTIETLGPIEEVHALGFDHHHTGNALADTTAVLLRAAGRQSASLTAIGLTADYFRFQVFGTKGWIELRDASRFTFQPIEGEREELDLPAVDTEQAEVEAFAAAIRGEKTFPVPLTQAVHGVAVLEAIGRSAIERKPILLG
ncbi:MAG TPA: Gfo/Idh/MocA family oxidoreductase [Beijerinckiaceae bacterium]|nr:Gfo/Idh/MocA family oxidoreductase [Beijerinckiaceae bacterium]